MNIVKDREKVDAASVRINSPIDILLSPKTQWKNYEKQVFAK